MVVRDRLAYSLSSTGLQLRQVKSVLLDEQELPRGSLTDGNAFLTD